MRKMPLTDALFLFGESRRTPMHVGCLSLFTLPGKVDDASFLSTLGNILSDDREMRRPFGEKLKMGHLGPLGPIHWEHDDLLDMDYHIRHSALPKPGRYRELFALVSRLHSTLLDRSRPLWEMHLIEGLQKRQFATYFKVHHCAIDGAGTMHLTNSMYSTNAKSRVNFSPYSQQAFEAYRQQVSANQKVKIRPREDEVRAVTEVLRQQLGSTVNVAQALRKYAKVWMGTKTSLSVPWHQVPKTNFNTRITGSRRFVAQSWPLARIRAIGKASGGTLNDTVLAICSGALRQYLIEHQDLPRHSLKAMTPVSLRAADDLESANAVSFMTANLGTNEKDPEKRLRIIQDSMTAAKSQLRGMSRREIEVYTALTQAPALLIGLTGLADTFPAFSTVISNVPGPAKKMYWNGARLDGLYPVSIPYDGAAINISLVSNNNNLDFGIVACRHTVPQLQRLIDYMDNSIAELEQATGLSTGPKGKSARQKKAAGASKRTATHSTR